VYGIGRILEGMRIQIIVPVLAALTVCAFAGQFRVGARMHVKENSMWFQTDTDLTVWQRFQKVATPAVIESYRDVVLGSRQAWQFGNIQSVKILSYEPEENQVKVEMLVPGKIRLDGSIWWLDGGDLVE
jgi:hypothetical protein